MKAKNILINKVRYDSMLATPINQILRYWPIVKFVKKILGNQNLRILEIGSGSAGITKFAKTPVFGLDINFEDKRSPYLKQVKHSALKKFPFEDNEFDIVLSVDAYEHLPKNKRNKTLEEMYRVSKKYVAFTTIFGLNRWHRKVLNTWGKKNRYYRDIAEHEKMGFPSLKEIDDFLKNKKCKIRKVYGTHPRLAYFLNLTEQNIFTKILSRTVLKSFLPIFKHYNGKDRIYFFIEKN